MPTKKLEHACCLKEIFSNQNQISKLWFKAKSMDTLKFPFNLYHLLYMLEIHKNINHFFFLVSNLHMEVDRNQKGASQIL